MMDRAPAKINPRLRDDGTAVEDDVLGHLDPSPNAAPS